VPARAASIVPLAVHAAEADTATHEGVHNWSARLTEMVVSLSQALAATTSDTRSTTVVVLDVGPSDGSANAPLGACAIEAARSLVQARALEQPSPPTNLLLIDSDTEVADVEATVGYLGSPEGAFVHGSSIDLRGRR
jgi:hypothetical protein